VAVWTTNDEWELGQPIVARFICSLRVTENVRGKTMSVKEWNGPTTSDDEEYATQEWGNGLVYSYNEYNPCEWIAYSPDEDVVDLADCR